MRFKGLVFTVSALLVTACSPDEQTTNAKACFNPDFFHAGNATRSRNIVSFDGNDAQVNYVDNVLKGTVEFQGQTVWQLHTTIHDDNAPHDEMHSNVYLRLDPEQPSIQMVGREFIHPNKRIGHYYKKPINHLFDMEPGEQVHYQQTAEPLVNGKVDEQSATPFEITRTYVGMEEVVVPAGKFTACHFTEHWQSIADKAASYDSTHSDIWIARGTGMQLKQAVTTKVKINDGEDGYESKLVGELLAADINGQHYPEK